MWRKVSLLWLAVKSDLRRLWFALRHPDAPGWLKWGTGLLAAYLLSPIDLVPDVIPVFGVVDDLIIIPLAIRSMLRGLPSHVRDHVERCATSTGEADTRQQSRFRRSMRLARLLK